MTPRKSTNKRNMEGIMTDAIETALREVRDALNALATKVEVHCATDALYRTKVDEHERKIKGNGEPSYETRFATISSKIRIIYTIGAAFWGITSAIIIWVLVRTLEKIDTLASLTNVIQ